jgi:isopentenyldiphosphate isomerase
MSAGELVDVVDESDRVIAQVDRVEMRARALRHRSIYVFVSDVDGRLFLHQRAERKDIYP